MRRSIVLAMILAGSFGVVSGCRKKATDGHSAREIKATKAVRSGEAKKPIDAGSTPGVEPVESSDLLVPPGCKAKAGTAAEPYSETGYAKVISHEKTGIELVFVPAGEFMMGSPDQEMGRADWETYRGETISQPFYLGKYEVTTGQFRRFKSSHSNRGDGPNMPNGFDYPVVNVSWEDAKAFSDWTGLRLPTEEEWEYACRAGSTTAYCFGDDPNKLADYAWYGVHFEKGSTHTVGEKKANAWGLHDTHGNVWEWCAGWFRGDSRALRGGGWNYSPLRCRSATRAGFSSNMRVGNLGFRSALSVPGEDAALTTE